MNYMSIMEQDIVNAPGIHTVIWVSGCHHRCPGCFNSNAWDFNAGNEFTESAKQYILNNVGEDICDGLVVLGGEPLADNNKEDVTNLILECKHKYPSKNIWVYTGYTYEELLERNDTTINTCLNHIDVLVDGRFEEDKKSHSLKYRGSSNQRIIDIPKTINSDNIIIFDSDSEFGVRENTTMLSLLVSHIKHMFGKKKKRQ